MTSDLERLLDASIQIERYKTEARLAADAIRYLRETLAERDAEIARLKYGFKRDVTQSAVMLKRNSELSDIAVISDKRRNA